MDERIPRREIRYCADRPCRVAPRLDFLLCPAGAPAAAARPGIYGAGAGICRAATHHAPLRSASALGTRSLHPVPSLGPGALRLEPLTIGRPATMQAAWSPASSKISYPVATLTRLASATPALGTLS